ncbi:MAG: substrate-binding domain-containing protein [Opitutaceae bacterium]
MKALFRVALIAALLPAALVAQSTIRFNGSDTITRKLQPFAPGIGAARSVEIKFTPNGVGNGIADLVAGRAEAAMVIGNVDYFARLLNEATPGSVDATKFRLFRLPEQFAAPATLVTHTSNPVKALTRDQIREIFTGQITNWKQVGGPDLAIIPVVQQPMDGYLAALSVVIVHGSVPTTTAKRVTKSADLCPVVAQTPGAIAFLSSAVATEEVNRLPIEPALIPPSLLVTIGDPAEPLLSIINDFVAKAK